MPRLIAPFLYAIVLIMERLVKNKFFVGRAFGGDVELAKENGSKTGGLLKVTIQEKER
ncbi:MAG TPA: hypothetical protein VK101_10395 [Limnochordia bacterium]|nr:hypothetical protein [Limnochordia bacterium]